MRTGKSVHRIEARPPAALILPFRVLASLNLPAALEDTTGCSLPPSIRDKAEAVRAKGGIQAIQKLISDLPVLLERNQEILVEVRPAALSQRPP